MVLLAFTVQVVSVNFHPYYKDEKNVGTGNDFHGNYYIAKVPEDIFSQKTPNINIVSN